MPNIGTGQKTLTDLNDAIIAGSQPSNPTINSLWIDTSVTPNAIKKWNGSIWVNIGELDPNYSETISDIQETLGNMANDDKIDFQERQVIRENVADIIGYVPYDKNILKSDLNGKTALSTVENPNIAKHRWINSILTPSSASWWEWTTQNEYNQVSKLDGTLKTTLQSPIVSGEISQQLFSFDIIQIVERKIGTIPSSTLTGKIAWVKANLKRISCNHWGYGTSPTGNKLTLTVWDVGANGWAGVVTHTGGVVTKLTRQTIAISSVIDVNGFVHFIAYAEPSNGTVASIVNTDFVEVEIEMNNVLPTTTTLDSQGYGDFYNVRKQAQYAGISTADAKYVSVATEYNNLKDYLEDYLITENLVPSFYEWDSINSNAVINSGYSLTLSPTAIDQMSRVWIPCTPNTTYTLSGTTNEKFEMYVYKADKTTLASATGGTNFTGTSSITVTTGADATYLQVRATNRTATTGSWTFTNPMFTIGATSKPFVPKLDVWDVSDTNKDQIVSVTKATFRDKWLKYYTAVKDLSTLVADQLKKNVDNVVVGGANYASNGNFEIDITESLWKNHYVGGTSGGIKEVVDISTETPPFKYAYHVKNVINQNGGMFNPQLWTGTVAEKMVDKEVTVSFWLKYQNIVQGTQSYLLGRFGEIIVEGETATGTKVYTYNRVRLTNNTSGDYYAVGTDMTWKKYYATHKLSLPNTTVKITNISFKHGLEGCTGEFWTTGIKVEFGNKVTDWSQSPLDLSPTQIASSIAVTPSAIDLISQNIDITGKVTFNSLDTATKKLVNNESSIINPNPNFVDWTGAYPVGYSGGIFTAGNTLTKTTDASQKGNVAKFDVTVVGGSNAYLDNPTVVTNYPYYQYLTVQSTFKLDSGTIDGAGILLRLDATTDVDYKIHFKDSVASPTLGKWYTITKVVKTSATAPTGFNGYMAYTMGAWGGFAIATPKSISISEVIVRSSTEQEINSYESGTLVNSWKKTGKTTIDGGQIETDSITATQINATALNLINNFSRNGNINNWTTNMLPSTFTYGTFPTVSPVSTRTGQGVGILTTNTDVQAFSDWFEVDPNKTYKVSMSIYHDSTLGSVYFGMHSSTDAVNGAGNINVIPFNTSTRTFGAESSNFYFWSATKLSTKSVAGNRDGGWVDIEGYILGENVNASEVPVQSSGTIGAFFAKMKAGTKYVRLRFLNYHTSPSYGDGVTNTTAYYYNPSVTEVGLGAITADSIKAGTITGINIVGTNITGTSTITGATITGTTINGGTINGGTVTGVNFQSISGSSGTVDIDGDGVVWRRGGTYARIYYDNAVGALYVSGASRLQITDIYAGNLYQSGEYVATQNWVTNRGYATTSYVTSQGYYNYGTSPTFWNITAESAINGGAGFRVNTDGTILSPNTYHTTTGSSANMFVSSGGLFYRFSSSIKYKEQVEDLYESEYSKVLDLRPVWYRSKGQDDRKDWGYIGLIAEEVSEIEPKLVHYKDAYKTIKGEDGTEIKIPLKHSELEPEGVQYDRIGVMLIPIVKDLKNQVAQLKQEVNELKGIE